MYFQTSDTACGFYRGGERVNNGRAAPPPPRNRGCNFCPREARTRYGWRERSVKDNERTRVYIPQRGQEEAASPTLAAFCRYRSWFLIFFRGFSSTKSVFDSPLMPRLNKD